MSPGSYLRLRREAAGLSIDDVAAALATEPRWNELDRKAWLELIEADAAPVGDDVQKSLFGVFRFDAAILSHLVVMHAGGALSVPHLCRVCACSWLDPCDEAYAGSCSWSATDPDLCTACEAAAQLGEAA